MTVKKKLTRSEVRDRAITILKRASAKAGNAWPTLEAYARWAEVRAAVFAVIPGRQTNKNASDFLRKATVAVARVIRRRNG